MSVQVSSFNQFLLDQCPAFDAAILREIRPSVSPRREDCRFLPNGLRRLWILRRFTGKRVKTLARMFKVSKSTVYRRYKRANSLVYDRLLNWLDNLPKSTRCQEEAMRDGWMCTVETGEFK